MATSARLAPPDVAVEKDSDVVDVRAWARFYVRTLLDLEGMTASSTALPRAS